MEKGELSSECGLGSSFGLHYKQKKGKEQYNDQKWHYMDKEKGAMY